MDIDDLNEIAAKEKAARKFAVEQKRLKERLHVS